MAETPTQSQPAATQPAAPSAPQEAQTQPIADVITTFKPLRSFTTSRPDNPTYVTSLDFDDQGDFVVSSASDDMIEIYDVKEGKRKQGVPSKKYGVHLARFAHHQRQVIHASTKLDHSIRLLDLHNESYVRYFSDHTDTVTSLVMSPASDQFVSASHDDTIAVWDIRSRSVQGKLNLTTPYLVAFDPSGSVLAIASQSTASVILYDFRNYDKAPFATFDLAPYEEDYTPNTKRRGWTNLEFSNDGKYLMITTDYHGHYILDAYEGDIKAFLTGKSGSPGRAAPYSTTGKPRGQGDATFTPDGRFVIGGNGENNDVLVWDLQQSVEGNKFLQPWTTLSNNSRTAILQYNPRYNMIASADKETVLWLGDDLGKSSSK